MKAQTDVSIIGCPAISHLPDSEVLCIHEDSQGFVWYGTPHGLFRDDGYDAVGFITEDDNRINCIAEDSAGNIWFGTPKGLYKIDRDDYTIVEIDRKRMQNESVKKLYHTSEGYIWASVLGFIRKYDEEGNCIKEYAVPDAKNNRKVYIDAFCQTRDGDIYIACGKPSLYKYNDKTDEFKPTSLSPDLDNLTGVFQDVKENFLWVTTKYGGILRFYPTDSRFETALIAPRYNKEPVYPINEEIYSIAQDSASLKLWVAGRNGIKIFEYSDSGLLDTCYDDDNKDSGFFRNLTPGRGGKMWLPSSYGVPAVGINGSLSAFIHNPLDEVKRKVGREVAIKNICQDNDRRYIWLIQPRLGLLLFDSATNQISVQSDFPELAEARLHEASILARSASGEGIWVGRNGRRTVCQLKRGDGLSMKIVRTVDFSGIVDPMVNVTYLHESQDGMLWIGTDDGYLCYDLSNGKLIKEKDGCGMVMSIRESADGDIWISTKSDGVYCISKNSKRSKRFPSLKGITDFAFVDDKIWLSTENVRLLSFDSKNNKISDISDKYEIGEGLILSLHQDDDDCVWIVTNNRLIRTMPEKEIGCGFNASELNIQRIWAVDKNKGVLLIGGNGGIASFNSSIAIANYEHGVPKVTKVESNGVEILSFPDKKIRIKAGCKDLKFFVSSFNHVSPDKSSFRYKLSGFDKKWSKTNSGENILSYNNLPYGTYTLELASLNNDGSWSEAQEVLTIYIDSPFWLKWWMITIYIILLLCLVYLCIKLIKHHYKKRSSELIGDSKEMLKMTQYLESPVSLPQPEFGDIDKVLLDNVTKAIEANMESSDFDINMLASIMNMSRSTLTRKIKAITGKNPGDLIQDIKLQHACQYLKNGEFNISEISDKIGYDRRYFTSVFKRKFGMTPREYMQSNENESKGVQKNEVNEPKN